jgi:eukaryotic-like serine/threonine-protein kinase
LACPHSTGDEVCATCAALPKAPLKPQGAQPEDATAQTVRRSGSSDSSDSLERPAPLAAEKIGRYLIQDVLGRGGMGLVYTAFDPVLNRKVAIKVLRARPGKGSHSGAEATRLLREAQAMAQLSHPNVVPVFDFGQDGDDVYVAMELIAGTTLYDWAKEKKPSWREVLPVFLAAGRGLQAAHAAGLVHRDFKPTNVLLDAQLQPHITDFGLARSVRSTSSDDALGDDFDISQPVSLDTALTRAGQVMGSPGYMAPEQYEGASTSPATDQYAFCVSLYESLYGKRPFRGADLQTLGALARKGEVPLPPKDRPAPSWIFDVICRGLSVNPADRHPSMAALLEALSKDPLRKRRLWLFGGAAALVATGVVAGISYAAVEASRECRTGGNKVDAVWNNAARAAARQAFVDTGRAWAPVAFEHANTALDLWARGWKRAHVAACEATRVRGDQTEHQLELRLACLDRQLNELETLATAFAKADATLVGQASDVAARLTPVSACANLGTLEARARLAPRSGEGWERLQRTASASRLLVAAGQLPAARERLEPAVKEAEALGEPGLLGAVFEARAELERASGKWVESRAAYERAVTGSLTAGDDASAVRQLAAMVSLVGWRLERPAEGLTLAAVARGILERLGGDAAIEARLAEGIGDAQWQSGDRAASLVSYRKAHDLLLALNGVDNLDVARLKSSIGWVLNEQGENDEARGFLEASRGARERMLGPDHPTLSETWNELGTLNMQGGTPDEAARCFLKALEIQKLNLAADAFPLTRAMLNLGSAHLAAGRVDEAATYLERAKANLDKTPDAPASWLTQYMRVMSRVHSARGKHLEAVKLIDETVRTARASFGVDHPSTADAVLAQAEVLLAAGKFKDALAAADAFIGVAAKINAEKTPDHANALRFAGRALVELKRPKEAAERLEKALQVAGKLPGHQVLKAELQLQLAQALWDAGEERTRAQALAAAALALFDSAQRAEGSRRAKAWVEAHRDAQR